MHQRAQLQRRVLHRALVRLERRAAKVARCVLRGEGSREAPDLPGGNSCETIQILAYFSNGRQTSCLARLFA